MIGGKTPLKPQGYTIVEVMIVLAVSSMLFVMAATFINGKQARTSFSTGVNEMTSRIQDTITQVNRGKYSDVKLKCRIDAGSAKAEVPAPSDPDTPQGANPKCVFVGKFYHFKVENNPQKYEVFSLAGIRDKTSLGDAGVSVISELTDSSNIPRGLEVESVKVDGEVNYGFGFAQGLGTAAADGFGYESGSQNITMIATRFTNKLSSNENSFSASNKVNAGDLTIAKRAVVCLTDGTRYATITLGDTNNELIANTRLGLNSCP